MNFRSPEPLLVDLLKAGMLTARAIQRASDCRLLMISNPIAVPRSPAVLIDQTGAYIYERNVGEARDEEHAESIHGESWDFAALLPRYNEGNLVFLQMGRLQEVGGQVVVDDSEVLARLRLERWTTTGGGRVYTAVRGPQTPLFDKIRAYVTEVSGQETLQLG